MKWAPVDKRVVESKPKGGRVNVTLVETQILVEKVSLRDGRCVALKMGPHRKSEAWKKESNYELLMISRLCHKNSHIWMIGL